MGISQRVAARYKARGGLLAFTLVLTTISFLLGHFWEDFIRNKAFLATIDYFSSPSASPTGSRIHRAGRLFGALSRKSPQRYEPYNRRIQGVMTYLEKPSNQRYYWGRMHLQSAQKAQTRADWGLAREHYQSTIAQGTEQAQLEAYLLLGELSQRQGDEEGFRQAMEAAYEFAPDLLMRFGGCPSMELLGGYIDQRDLELDAPIHVVLVWQVERAAGFPGRIVHDDRDWHLFAWRDRVFQVGSVENLVPEGGFEGALLPSEALLRQMPMRLFRSQETDHAALVYEAPEQKHNLVLMLNGKGENAVGLGSPKASVPSDREDIVYLVAGEYQSSGEAVPKIGVRWWLRHAVSWSDNDSIYPVQTPSEKWDRFARLLAPPIHASEVQVWVLNQDKTSSLRVDNLGLLPVPLPCSLD